MDFSWIVEEERLENIEENCPRESISHMDLISIYMNTKLEIEIVENENIDISEKTTLPIQEWIKERKKYTPTGEYHIQDVLWHHIPIEPEKIQEITPDTTCFMNTYNSNEIPVEIAIEKSIFIFHSLTTLYFFFIEKEKRNVLPVLVSSNKKDHKKTVKIVIPLVPSKTSHSKNRITRKQNKSNFLA